MNRSALRLEREGSAPHIPATDFQVRVVSGSLLGTLLKAMLEQFYPHAGVALTACPTPGLGLEDVVIDSPATGRRLVVFGSPPSRETLSRHIGAGAWSLLLADATGEELRAGVDSLKSGPPYVSSNLVRRLADAPVAATLANGVHVTAREREVLRLLNEGQSNSEMAASLAISANTVRSHLQSLSSKLGATSRLKLLARAREAGLLLSQAPRLLSTAA